MNASEGLKRVAKLVRWIGTGFAVITFGGGAVMLFDSELIGDRLLVIAITIIIASIFYFGGKALGWVIDGFAESKDN